MVRLVAAGLNGFGDPPLLLQVCFVVLGALLFPLCCLTLGCRQMPASLRDDSSLADPSLAFGALYRGSECSENGGPSCPIVSTSDSSPNGSTQEGALQTFLQRRKNGSSSLVPRPAPYWLWHSKPSRSFASKVRLRGITHKAESNSNCLGQATVVLVRWTFQPVAALIVRHVSSGQLDTYG